MDHMPSGEDQARMIANLVDETRDFTVTIAGPERHAGEAPYLYVVSATTHEEAARTASRAFRVDQETDDSEVQSVLSGLPTLAGAAWNARRGAVPDRPRPATQEPK